MIISMLLCFHAQRPCYSCGSANAINSCCISGAEAAAALQARLEAQLGELLEEVLPYVEHAAAVEERGVWMEK